MLLIQKFVKIKHHHCCFQPSKWDEVAVALNRMQMAANIDANDEVDARNYFDSLRKVTSDFDYCNL